MDLIVLESPNKVRDVQKYAGDLGLHVKLAALFPQHELTLAKDHASGGDRQE